MPYLWCGPCALETTHQPSDKPWKPADAQDEVGKGAFQELDQVAAAAPYCKWAGRVSSLRDVMPVLTAAVKARRPAVRAAPSPPTHARVY